MKLFSLKIQLKLISIIEPSFSQCLLTVLDKKNIKIQLISSNPEISSLVNEAFLTLLYPFEFTHILISNLPFELEQYLEAPLPYLIRMNIKQAEMYTDVILVFLDSNYIKQNQTIDVPEELFDNFVSKLYELDYYCNPELIHTIGEASTLPKEDDSVLVDQYQIREVLLGFNIFKRLSEIY
ncbi:unnamed protein product (macronuclear) [Paramecium tetraurelia]|uniref:UDENN domain-containing protein n=1 Tax=Paramecium tetraurelia TaxID=5888 RepID=A0E0G3_PARTE|nr:uncharacterized protein GSPATT00021948001 [Paramecium tetraurelia]CAK88780.1 unnamed protein product [Paramecium tetraurelia]|eukprot:XP_001456177.1 hypothetical protein (macronuclear) [Paramecium tetraurelia strain d4-2]